MHNKQSEEQLIIFRVGPVLCSVVSCLVESIVDNQPLHRFPGQANFICGVLHYRDHAVSIVNLFNKFNFPEPKSGPNSCFIMGVTIYGTVGFWVDEVLEITTHYKMHQTKLPTYSGANVFDCALLWSDQVVLQTDLNCLFTMNESAPLQDWIKQDENNQLSVGQNNSVETSGQVAWRKAENEASSQEIHSLMSRGAQLSKMLNPPIEALPDSSTDPSEVWSAEAETITVSPLTEISETTAADTNVDENVDANGQLMLLFQSHKNNKPKPELITKPKNAVEPKEIKTTLEAIAAQHGDIDSVRLEPAHAEVAKNSIPSEKAFLKSVVEKNENDKENRSSLIFEKISVANASSFLDTTNVITNTVKSENQHRNDKKQEYEVEKLNLSSSGSEVYDNFENDWDTLLFTSAMLDHERGGARNASQDEFSVLNEDDSVAILEDVIDQPDGVAFHKRNEAVERVAKRIARKNESKDTTSTFRIMVSVLVSAVIVFVIQSHWLNSDDVNMFANVPSLQLLKEIDNSERHQKTGSIDTVVDKFGDEYSLKSVVKDAE